MGENSRFSENVKKGTKRREEGRPLLGGKMKTGWEIEIEGINEKEVTVKVKESDNLGDQGRKKMLKEDRGVLQKRERRRNQRASIHTEKKKKKSQSSEKGKKNTSKGERKRVSKLLCPVPK